MPLHKIVVVDDRPNTLKVIEAILTDEGFTVLPCSGGLEALQKFREHPDIAVVLSDLKMPGMDGLTLFHEIRKLDRHPPFVIMTAHGTVRSAVQALKQGVAHYLIKPLDYEELVIVLNKAVREYKISRELLTLREQTDREQGFHRIIGATDKMRQIFDMVKTVGATDVSVLIYGETGTGKELLARALHAESRRREGQMVCINSAALSESLLEAELFGYVKGAFTGAAADRKGRLEIAHRGTLFLDEIGHMSLRLQAKLLRFLQEMTFEPVGGTDSRVVDVRVIAATNFDLQKEIRAGRFLSDLLYRIEVIPIRVPALRQRRDDIYLLADHFTRRYGRQYEKKINGITPEAMEVLVHYRWPGNVRELKNTLARAVILSKNTRLGIEDIPRKLRDEHTAGVPSRPNDAPLQLLAPLPARGVKLKDLERELIQKTLRHCEGNKSLAAEYLGISRKTLYKKMRNFKIAK